MEVLQDKIADLATTKAMLLQATLGAIAGGHDVANWGDGADDAFRGVSHFPVMFNGSQWLLRQNSVQLGFGCGTFVTGVRLEAADGSTITKKPRFDEAGQLNFQVLPAILAAEQ